MTERGDRRRRTVRLDIALESEEERTALRGALLAAQASELSEIRRRAGRLSFGYGSEATRESMSDVVDQAQLRWTMLGRLLTALDRETGSAKRP